MPKKLDVPESYSREVENLLRLRRRIEKDVRWREVDRKAVGDLLNSLSAKLLEVDVILRT